MGPSSSETDFNPFQDPLRFERRVEPCVLVIFGANGDLTMRKLVPSLYRLAYERRLPAGFAVVGNSRTAMTDEAFRQKMQESVKQYLEDSPFEADLWRDFEKCLYYVPGDLNDPALYQALGEKIAQADAAHATDDNVLYYLSTQPSFYIPVIQQLGQANLNHGQKGGYRRIVIEKPFGHDTASSKELAEAVKDVFPEKDVYRIDHYLGKETVQNVFAFRFGNGIFEPLWDRRYVNHVQITAAESIGVGTRGAFYQEVGALKDMIQNHLLQVMATVAMEPPSVFEPDAVRDERAKLLRAIRVLKTGEVLDNSVPGQYGPAPIGGEKVAGFRQEQGVKEDAQTPTYAAIAFMVDNWRWAGVPFYIRTGKRLARRVTEIAIQFNEAPHTVFSQDLADPLARRPNMLILRIQPEEGISLRFLSKQPGTGMRLRPVSMDFNYGSSFGARTPTAYETLLIDAMAGDGTLYTRQDMVDASWNVVQPIMEVWGNTKFGFPNYDSGTWGPQAADDMLGRRGHQWRTP